MSEEKISFMAALDAWSDESIIAPLFEIAGAFMTEDEKTEWSVRAAEAKKAIRQKVLESYRNGQKKPVAQDAPAVPQAGPEVKARRSVKGARHESR